MFKKLLAAASALLIAGGLALVAVAAPASAHHTDISAKAVCTTDGGWDITWSVVNSENIDGTITATNNASVPKGTVLPANPVYYSNKPASVPTTFVQHVTSNDPVSLAITVAWVKNGSTPTHNQSMTFSAFPAACGDVEVTPLEPAVTTVTKCDTDPVVIPTPVTGVLYSTKLDTKTGDYTVTATPEQGFFFKDDPDQTITFTGNAGARYDCVSKPTPRIAVAQCTYAADGTVSDRDVTITFDNSASNKAVLFQVVGFPQYDTLVPALGSVAVNLQKVGPGAMTYTVTADGQTFTLPVDACPITDKPQPKQRPVVVEKFDCASETVTVLTTIYTTDYVFDTVTVTWVEMPEVAGTPVTTYRTFTAGEKTAKCGVTVSADPAGSACKVADPNTALSTYVRVAWDTRVLYTIENTVTGVVTPASAEYTLVDAGKYLVTAVAAPGYELQPAPSRAWPIFVEDVTKCDPVTLPIVKPLYSITTTSCTTPGTYTIGADIAGTVNWTVNGTPTPSGTYTVTNPGDITIEATSADPVKYGIDPSWKNPVVLKFPAPSIVCELETLAYTGSSNGGLFGLAGGMVFVGIGGLLIARRKWAESK